MNKKEILEILFADDFSLFDSKLNEIEMRLTYKVIQKLKPILNVQSKDDNVLLHDTLSDAFFELSTESINLAYKTIDSVLN